MSYALYELTKYCKFISFVILVSLKKAYRDNRLLFAVLVGEVNIEYETVLVTEA